MSVIKRLSLYEFTLYGQDLVSIVRIIEGFFFLKKIYESFAGTLETVRNREVSVQTGWTVLVAEGRKCVHENYALSVRKCTHGEKVTWGVWRLTLAPGLP